MKRVALHEICELKKGRKPNLLSDEQIEGWKPYILIQSFDGSRTSFSNDTKCTECKEEDTLIVSDGARSGLASFGHAGYIGSTIAALVPNKEKVSPKYLHYFVQSQFDLLNSHTKGATIPHLDKAYLMAMTLYLPSLPEQERIVRLLDEAESLRATRERANVCMEQFVPALFQEMFGDPVKTKFLIKTLNEVADVVSGIAKGRKFNGQKPVTINYLRVANVQAGYLDLSEIKTIEALPSEVEALQVRIGDVLLTEGGDFDKLGRGAMLEVDLPNCIHQNHVFRARVNQDYLLPVFFHDFLQTQQAKKYFLSCAKKTTNLASINLTQLRALPVPLPPLTLQREFAARVGEARGVQSAQGKSAERVEALYQSMLARAFAGEL